MCPQGLIGPPAVTHQVVEIHIETSTKMYAPFSIGWNDERCSQLYGTKAEYETFGNINIHVEVNEHAHDMNSSRSKFLRDEKPDPLDFDD